MVNKSKIKPIEILPTEPLTKLERNAIIDGVVTIRDLLLSFTNIPKVRMPVNYLDVNNYERQERWANEIGKQNSSNINQVNGGVMSQYLLGLQKETYIVYVTKDDLYICTDENGKYIKGSGNNGFSAGLSSENGPSIISTYRFKGIEDEIERARCLKTLVMHEMGHLFGVINETYRKKIDYRGGAHCVNDGCVMRQGWNVPEDWQQMTKDRIGKDPFCPQCLLDMRDWLNKKNYYYE
jgi:predicted Zn-dependent protease